MHPGHDASAFGPPGVFGPEDHVFSMTFRVKSDDAPSRAKADDDSARRPGSPPAQRTEWRDSRNGVHSFLVFDYHLESNLTHIQDIAPEYDYVWGASRTQVATWRASCGVLAAGVSRVVNRTLTSPPK